MKFFFITLIFVPFCIFCQNPDSLLTKLHQEYVNRTLDSVKVNISKTHDKFNKIDTTKIFYIIYDTLTDSTGFYSVGATIVDPFMEFNGIKVGIWAEYYPNGQIKSKGEYSVGAVTFCQSGGPSISGYNYKSGIWRFYHENGQIEATGKYILSTKSIKSSCGIDEYYVPVTDSNWLYWDINGIEIKIR